MDVIKTREISMRLKEEVLVHPLVLLSVVDNYNRIAEDTRKRVDASCSVLLPKAPLMSQTATQFDLKKIGRIQAFGFLITITMSPCFHVQENKCQGTCRWVV